MKTEIQNKLENCCIIVMIFFSVILSLMMISESLNLSYLYVALYIFSLILIILTSHENKKGNIGMVYPFMFGVLMAVIPFYEVASVKDALSIDSIQETINIWMSPYVTHHYSFASFGVIGYFFFCLVIPAYILFLSLYKTKNHSIVD